MASLFCSLCFDVSLDAKIHGPLAILHGVLGSTGYLGPYQSIIWTPCSPLGGDAASLYASRHPRRILLPPPPRPQQLLRRHWPTHHVSQRLIWSTPRALRDAAFQRRRRVDDASSSRLAGPEARGGAVRHSRCAMLQGLCCPTCMRRGLRCRFETQGRPVPRHQRAFSVMVSAKAAALGPMGKTDYSSGVSLSVEVISRRIIWCRCLLPADGANAPDRLRVALIRRVKLCAEGIMSPQLRQSVCLSIPPCSLPC